MTMIAYVGPDLPQDLMTATGACSGPLGWNVDRAMHAADRWLESKFPLWTRSILQDWADGGLDGTDAVIFSRADDAAQRLYYYVCELRERGDISGPEPMIFDAATIGRASSVAHMRGAIERLAARLGVDDAALEGGIVATNVLRDVAPEIGGDGPLCLLAGTPPPDRRLHTMIEAAGWRAAGQTLTESWQHPGDLHVDEGSGDPCAAIARQLHGAAQGSRAFRDHAGALMAQAQDVRASAAILWFAEEDEARIWHLPAQRDALAQADVPTLILTRRDWRANDGAGEEIAAFLTEHTA
jgi:hypothetical protein